MIPDAPLLDRYAAHRDADAFREWVELRIPLVYSVALRVLTGDRHLAEDVTQQVFATAARRAAKLARHPAVGGWLFTHTRFTAAKLVRSRQRRDHRERTAAMDPALTPDPPVDWSRVRPEIDAALAALPAADRDAVILRFFEQADYATIGARLQLTANAARMRVDRALEKLSTQLGRRGIRSTAAALGTALGAHAVNAAPAGLAASVAGSVLAGATAATLTTTSLLAMLKAPLAATAVVIAAGTSLLVFEGQTSPPPPNLASPVPAGTTSSSPTLTPPPSANSDFIVPTDTDYATLETEITTLQTRLAALDQAAVAKLKQPRPNGKIYSVKELDAAPQPRFQSQPVYPFALRQTGVAGEATIAVTINQSGAVSDLATVNTTHEAFAEAALEAVSKWRFSPGRLAGQPVNTRVRIPVKFTISQESPAVHEWF